MSSTSSTSSHNPKKRWRAPTATPVVEAVTSTPIRRSSRKKHKPSNLLNEILSNPNSPRAHAYFLDHPDVSLDELDRTPGPSDLEWLQQELQDALDEENADGVQLMDLATDGVQALRERLMVALNPQTDTGADLDDFVASDSEKQTDSDASYHNSDTKEESSSDTTNTDDLTEEEPWESACLTGPDRGAVTSDDEEEDSTFSDDDEDPPASDPDFEESGSDTGDDVHDDGDYNNEEMNAEDDDQYSSFRRPNTQHDEKIDDVWF